MAKYIAFHLPQYHTFPENDKWWGKNFTDWVNVKNAKPLFKSHIQPVIPLNEEYYNMMDHATRVRQAKLAKEYGLYGFCYYHYYFNGKLLMEKPLETLLKENDIDFPYCLCWANEPWTRAWDGKTKEILMAQEYGNERDWEKHFNYLISFFKDKRYICINNKPLFVIYRTNNIPRCDEMIKFWDNMCKKNGFDGIYICEELNAFQSEPVCCNSNAVIAFEPSNVQRKRSTISRIITIFMGKIKTKNFLSNLKIFNYETIWKKIISQRYCTNGKKLYYGAFVGWDNTPRKKDSGMIYINASPTLFANNLSILNKKADQNNSEFIFINAWNEWAEGAHLEPDNINKYKYLEALKSTKLNEMEKKKYDEKKRY